MSEQRRRRVKSEHRLHQLTVRTSPDLDLLPAEDSLTPRNGQEIGKRALVLHAVVAYAQLAGGGAPIASLRTPFAQWLEREGLWETVTESERGLFDAAPPDESVIGRASWRIEAVRALLFALDLAPGLALPAARCDFLAVAEALPAPRTSSGPFLASLRPRLLSEILDAADLALCVQWAMLAAEREGEEPPTGFEPAVAAERLHALSWVLGLTPDWE